MKISELIDRVTRPAILEDWMSADLVTIVEDGGTLIEMTNLKSRITDLPANIVLWTRPQPAQLPHNKYRIKVTKDHMHVATYLISSTPALIGIYASKKYALDSYEDEQVQKFIRTFASLLISYVDAKITDDELEFQIQKINKETI
jgi:hypothetical protein